MSDFSSSGPVYGLMAEFDSAQELVAAAHKTHEAGYQKIDAYSPFPIEGLAEAIGFHKNNVPLVVLIGGIIGGLLEMAGFAALTAALEQQGSMCGSRPGRPTATARWPVAG